MSPQKCVFMITVSSFCHLHCSFWQWRILCFAARGLPLCPTLSQQPAAGWVFHSCGSVLHRSPAWRRGEDEDGRGRHGQWGIQDLLTGARAVFMYLWVIMVSIYQTACNLWWSCDFSNLLGTWMIVDFFQFKWVEEITFLFLPHNR